MRHFLSVVSAVILVALGVAPGRAAIITTDTSVTDSIPGVSTFTTRGSNMDGMLVTVTTLTGSQTIAWSSTGVGSGHAVGSDWEISLAGNSFADDAWVVTFDSGVLIQTIALDGAPGMVLFDRSSPNPGTPDSAGGKDFDSSLANDGLVAAQYSRQIAIGAALPVGDEWRTLFIDFTATAVQEDLRALTSLSFTFSQDTDNEVLSRIPEPASLGLLGLGLAGLGAVRRRRRRP